MKINVNVKQVYRDVKDILMGETFYTNSALFLVTRHFAENGSGVRCYIDLATGFQIQLDDNVQVIPTALQVIEQ